MATWSSADSGRSAPALVRTVNVAVTVSPTWKLPPGPLPPASDTIRTTTPGSGSAGPSALDGAVGSGVTGTEVPSLHDTTLMPPSATPTVHDVPASPSRTVIEVPSAQLMVFAPPSAAVATVHDVPGWPFCTTTDVPSLHEISLPPPSAATMVHAPPDAPLTPRGPVHAPNIPAARTTTNATARMKRMAKLLS